MIINHYVATTDVHVGGETFRFLSGLQVNKLETTECPKNFLEGNRLLLKRLLEEPRGHSGMRICVVKPAILPEVDARLLFIDTEGNTAVVEHGLLAAATLMAELYNVKKDCFCFECNGKKYKIPVTYDEQNEQIKNITFEQTVRYIIADLPFKNGLIDIVNVDQVDQSVAIANASEFNLGLTTNNLNALRRAARVWFEKMKQLEESPQAIDLLLFYQRGKNGGYQYVVLDKNGRIDRSPYLGAWAFSAFIYHKGVIKAHTGSFHLTNFLDHSARGGITKVIKATEVPILNIAVKGKGYIIGSHQFVVDPDDPLNEGFILK